MTIIPAEPGFVVVIPLFDNDGIAGLAEHPVAAWRIEADSGRRIPIIDHGEVEEEIDVEEEIEEGRYALQHPDGSYHFADGERCDNEDAVVESFEKAVRGPTQHAVDERSQCDPLYGGGVRNSGADALDGVSLSGRPFCSLRLASRGADMGRSAIRRE